MIKLKIILFDGAEKEIECINFEFRTNQVSNWIKVTYKDGTIERIHNLAVIKDIND